MKVLASAYACEPNRGSEPGVGWNYAIEMSKHHELWVLTRANNRGVIEEELKNNPAPNLHFIYFDLAPIWQKIKNRIPFGVHMYYFFWQRSAQKVVLQVDSEIGFDISQHVTFGQCWMPSALSKISCPYIYGPLAGGERVPSELLPGFSLIGRIREKVRAYAQKILSRIPSVKEANRNAAIVLASTDLTEEACKRLGAKDTRLRYPIGIDQTMRRFAASQKKQKADNKVTFFCVGRLLDWKAVWLIIRAFDQANIDHAELVIAGDGPDRKHTKKAAAKALSRDKIHFLGNITREEVLERMGSMTALVFPTLRDPSGMVLMEAFAFSKPVLCFDWAGPREVTRGVDNVWRVPVGSVSDAVSGFAEAMTEVSQIPPAQQYEPADERFLFHKNVEYYCSLFEEVLAER